MSADSPVRALKIEITGQDGDKPDRFRDWSKDEMETLWHMRFHAARLNELRWRYALRFGSHASTGTLQ